MKKVISITLSFLLIFSIMTAIPAFADEEIVTTVSLAGTTDDADNPVNIILTDKNAATANAASIKYINQVKPASDGKWEINFKVKGTLSDYKILFRQNGTTANKIAPEFVSSITPGMSVKLSASLVAKTVTATVKIDKGNTFEQVNFDVIIAAYDDDGNLIEAYSPSVSADADVEELTRDIERELPDNAAYAKVFCWKDLTPITKSIQLTEASDPEKAYINHRGSVGNVFRKLENGDDVNIVYLGGSVTVGTGLPSWQDYDTKSWRGITMKWFKDQYPNNTINFYNSAVGGTGSFFGAMRTAEDVLSFNPDLVFVMYPINDVYDYMTEAETKRQMEDIIWQIRTADPETDIIMGYDIDTNQYVDPADGLYDMVRWQEQVAKKYNISVINMGRKLYDVVNETGSNWSDYLSDIVHPKEEGYKIYADVAVGLLEKAQLETTGDVEEYILPAQRSFGTAMNPYMIKAADEFAIDATPVVNSGSLYSHKYLLEPGASFTFEISGDSVGLKILETGVAGEHLISYDIDNGAFTGEYDVAKTRQVIKLAESCGEDNHTVKVTNNSDVSISVLAAFTWDAE